ncbi:MAG TPA: glycosyltransferase family 4 protein [Thermoleophilaceae bacterium]
MRILVFHGYLLRGTGSNIYNASLAAALAALGHDVHILCQDRHAAELPFVGAVGRWEGGELRVDGDASERRVTAYLPDIGRVLPLYVQDEYEGFDAKRFLDLTDTELDHYLAANVAAVRDVVERVRPDVALANHALMGPAVLARALGDELPYAVKIHGSALEYTLRPDPDRFLPYAKEGVARANGVLVGSRHMAERLWEFMPETRERTRLGPPGVDVHRFRPLEPAQAAERVSALADRLEGSAAAGWGGDAGAAAALRELDPRRDSLVAFVGKLIVSKGIDLLLAAWPLVVARVPDARLCVVGFGTYREASERIVAALRDGDLDALRDIASRGRELEGGPASRLRFLIAFLDGLEGERRDAYVAAARTAAERVHFTGRLEHDDLPDLLPACLAEVVPSTFPEAYGMVAAEAASCGVLPLSAVHSGLAEVSATLAPTLDPALQRLLGFDVGEGAVEEIARKLVDWLTLAPAERRKVGAALAATAAERFGWEHVAETVIAAAQGRLGELPDAAPAGESWRPPLG